MNPMMNPRFKKECSAARAVPMNRNDLLIPRKAPSNGIYTRPAKYPMPLHRPDTAMNMILNLEAAGYEGSDLEAEYERKVKETKINRVVHEQLRRQSQFNQPRIGVVVQQNISRGDVVTEQFINAAAQTGTLGMLGLDSRNLPQIAARAKELMSLIQEREILKMQARDNLLADALIQENTFEVGEPSIEVGEPSIEVGEPSVTKPSKSKIEEVPMIRKIAGSNKKIKTTEDADLERRITNALEKQSRLPEFQ